MDDWQTRVDAVWADADRLSEDGVVAAIDALAAERPAGDALALFERAGARDSAGLEDEAEPLYRAESLALLRAEFAEQPDHPYADAATAFAALALASMGETTAALSATLGALAKHLPAYRRSVENYAADLLD